MCRPLRTVSLPTPASGPGSHLGSATSASPDVGCWRMFEAGAPPCKRGVQTECLGNRRSGQRLCLDELETLQLTFSAVLLKGRWGGVADHFVDKPCPQLYQLRRVLRFIRSRSAQRLSHHAESAQLCRMLPAVTRLVAGVAPRASGHPPNAFCDALLSVKKLCSRQASVKEVF